MRNVQPRYSSSSGGTMYKCDRCDMHGPSVAGVNHLHWCERIDELEREVERLTTELHGAKAIAIDQTFVNPIDPISQTIPQRGLEG